MNSPQVKQKMKKEYMTQFSITSLRCEHLLNPSGIDSTHPRFSWQIFANEMQRGVVQKAYQILVASSEESLLEGKADYWDSGKIHSNQSVLVPYEGKELQSNDMCYWRVKVWTGDGEESFWSASAHFSIGLLHKTDWKGEWIQHPRAQPCQHEDQLDETQHLWFKNEVVLDKRLAHAFLYLASSGYHELYVNGTKVDDRVLAPNASRLDKRVYYVTYDLKDILKKGKNDIFIHYGPGWSRFPYYKNNGAISAIKVQFCGKDHAEEKHRFHSGDNWLCTESFSRNINGCRFEDNGGEAIDGRLIQKRWMDNIPSEDWISAKSADWSVELSPQKIQPTKIVETIRPVSIEKIGEGYRVDFGKNFTGFLRLRFDGQNEADQIKLTLLEALDGQERNYQQHSSYICRGKGEEETFEHRFNYCCGRYLDVTGLNSPPKPDNICGLAISNDLRRTGKFECSNALMNKIYETDLWTFIANTSEGFTADCPHRERQGYGEEHVATSWGIGLPNFESMAFYSNLVGLWSDVQMENGWFHHTAPQINEHFGGPMWSSAGISVAMRMYEHCKDRAVIETIFDAGIKWIDFLESNEDGGLLKNYFNTGDSWDWGRFLGDWAAPGERNERGDSIEAEYFNNCVYVMNLIDLSTMATVLGRKEDDERITQKISQLRENIHTRFFDKKKGTYGGDTQVHLAFALLVGVVPLHLREAMRHRLEHRLVEQGYLDMGSSGLPILLKYLVDHSEDAVWLYPSLEKTTEPGYGYFLEQGETTWPEHWSCKLNSRIHTCYTGIASWFIKSLGGIRPDPEHPGFQRFYVEPVVPDEVDFVSTQTESPYGKIVSNWRRNGPDLRMHVEIPPNSYASVRVPGGPADNILLNGSLLENNSYIHVSESRARGVQVELKSGVYEIEILNS